VDAGGLAFAFFVLGCAAGWGARDSEALGLEGKAWLRNALSYPLAVAGVGAGMAAMTLVPFGVVIGGAVVIVASPFVWLWRAMRRKKPPQS